MNEANNYPIWYLLAIAVIGSLPATLTALAGVIYAIKVRADVKNGQANIEAKVDAVKVEVDGKTKLMVEAIRDIAGKVVDKAHESRRGRKTDNEIHNGG